MKINSILVSQPVPAIAEKSPYHEIYTKFGAAVSYRPFIQVAGVSLKEYRSQRIEILDYSAVIFTNRTTIDHFFRICEEARITVPETMKYICNTEATALYLQKYIVYRKRKIFFANGTFANLMELVMKYKDEKLLLTLSEPHNTEIPLTLEKLKIKFGRIILSRTVSADLSNVDLSKYNMLVFFSPSEISSLVAAFGTEKLPMIATFGDGTTRVAIDAGLTVNVMAPTPEAPSMAKAIEIFMHKVNLGEEIAPVRASDSRKTDEFVKSHEIKASKRARLSKNSAAATKNKARSGKKSQANPDVKHSSAATASGTKVSISKPGKPAAAANRTQDTK